MSITESPKNKIMGETGFYGLSACRGSSVDYFLFYRVSKKIEKTWCFLGPLFMAEVLSRHGTELWMPDFLIILIFGPSVMLTTDSKK